MRPRARGGVVTAAVVAVVALGCSVLVNEDSAQCTRDADCAKFPGTQCRSGGCVPAPPLPDAGDDTRCTTTQDCLATPTGRFSICRNKTCISLLSRDCGAVYGSFTSDQAIVIGALVPSFGTHLSTGLSLQNAIRLASQDFSAGLPPAGSASRRPIAIVVCDETANAKRAATHLVSDLGVPAIVGATFNDATLDVASVTSPAGVFLLSPTAAGDLAAVTSGGLVRRIALPSGVEGQAMAKVSSDVVEPLVTAAGAKMRVAVVSKTDSGSAALKSAFVASLVLNGKPPKDAANAGLFVDAPYGNPDVNPSADVAGAVFAVVSAAPDLVVVVGNTEGATRLIASIEQSWSSASPRPRYLVSSGVEVPELLTLIGPDDALRRRVYGTAPGDPNGTPRGAFFVRYAADVHDGISDVHVYGTANAYDAYYVVAYAIASLGSAPVTGRAIAGAMGKVDLRAPPLVDVGPKVLTGPTGAPDDTVFGELRGAGIDLNGTSSNLDFDAVTGDVSSVVHVWCVVRDAQTRGLGFAASGKVFDPVVGALGGTAVAGCW